MRHTVVRWTMALALSAGVVIQAVHAEIRAAEEAQRTLPTLLIKGEVISVDTSDPQAALLKVKDRYGFETPIYLSGSTKIAQGDQTQTAANLAAGTAVEVEYNFDINTAKRHAVNVAVSVPAATAAATPATASMTTAAPIAPATSMQDTAPALAIPEAAIVPAPAQPAASATSEQPASTPKAQ